MKIYRNGNEFELTSEELEQAFYEYQEYEEQEKIKTILIDDGIKFTKNDVEEILSIVDNELENCDSYWNIKLDIIQNVIEEYFDTNKIDK